MGEENSSKIPSIDLIYERSMKQYDIVTVWMQAVDNKVALIMSTSTIAFSVMTGISAPNLKLDVKLIPFIIGAALFMAVSFALLQCLKTSSFKVISNPSTLLKYYVGLTPEVAKLTFIRNSIEHYKTNSSVLKFRAKYLNISIYCMVAEILALFIGIIVVRV